MFAVRREVVMGRSRAWAMRGLIAMVATAIAVAVPAGVVPSAQADSGSWIPDPSTLNTLPGTTCTIGDQNFYSHMDVSGLPRDDNLASNGLTNNQNYIAALNSNGWTHSSAPLSYSLDPWLDNQRSNDTLHGVPVEQLASNARMMNYEVAPADGATQLQFYSKVSGGYIAKVYSGGHSQAAIYPNLTDPVAGTSYPHPGTVKFMGYPGVPFGDAWSMSYQQQPDGSCTLFELQGLNQNHIPATTGHQTAPFGVNAAMQWNTATMRQSTTQERQDQQRNSGRWGDGSAGAVPLGVTATLAPVTPEVVRVAEVQPGAHIDHVLDMSATTCSPVGTKWPARASDCGSTNPTTDPPYGTIFRLPASFDPSLIDPPTLDRPNGDPAFRAVVTALKTHGAMLMSTNGPRVGGKGQGGLLFESANCGSSYSGADTTATCWGTRALGDIRQILFSDLEAVDTSALGACHPTPYNDNSLTDTGTPDDWFRLCPPTP
jgi:hypothetical protein